MKVILDIKDNRSSFLMELLKSLDYVQVLKEIKDEEKLRLISRKFWHPLSLNAKL